MSSITGSQAETIAKDYLIGHGMIFVDKNYRAPTGEIDLIMQDDDTLVFVEVRYRAPSNYLHPLESIDDRKITRLIHTAEHYLVCQDKYATVPARFDVVAIGGQDVNIEWIPNAIQAS